MLRCAKTLTISLLLSRFCDRGDTIFRPQVVQLNRSHGPQFCLRKQDGFLLKFLYWPFYLAWGINPGITEWISNCVYSLSCKDEVLGNSIMHNHADQWWVGQSAFLGCTVVNTGMRCCGIYFNQGQIFYHLFSLDYSYGRDNCFQSIYK